MSYGFYTEPSIHFDEAIAKLRESRKVVFEPMPGVSTRPFLYGHTFITSLDRRFGTFAGRVQSEFVDWRFTESPKGPCPTDERTEEERRRDPAAELYFDKCGGLPREGARLFLVMLSEIIGVEIVTEWGDPVTDADAWSVRYTLGIKERESEV